MDFQEWINQKYLDWRGDKVGRDASETEFARYLGVRQQVVYAWRKQGKTPKEKHTIDKLIARYGSEVYDVLDLPPQEFEPTDSELRPIAEMIMLFPERLRPKVRQSITETLVAVVRKELDLDDAGAAVVRRLLEILENENK